MFLPPLNLRYLLDCNFILLQIGILWVVIPTLDMSLNLCKFNHLNEPGESLLFNSHWRLVLVEKDS